MTFNIVGKRNTWFGLSTLLVVASITCLIIFGLKPGIDFTGGSLIEVSFTHERPGLEEMQSVFENQDYGNVRVQPTEENGYILKMRFISEEEHQVVLSKLRENFEVLNESSVVNAEGLEINGSEEFAIEGMEVVTVEDSESIVNIEEGKVVENRLLEERVETIGPAISAQLKERSAKAAIAVILAIVAYVAYAFRKVSKPVKSWKYGITAIIALLHDVIITMGIFSLLGHYMGVEVDIPFVVAMLTILGYSVNDTIVVFDRVRENLIKHGYENFSKIVNKGVNETLVRSINTSITTLLVLSALFFFGGDSIHYFSLALMIGVLLGTYSSIFLASPLLVVWKKLPQR
ncbi:protein translocase subunit SecF [Candidatus Parcubacteria bacterium]|nr:protein translocase subunit SecF [Candidatus Parcubacteria bacterium]MBT3949184.1 protein translocase subunit SecF [Candidatus Parcubacteria bacterium]